MGIQIILIVFILFAESRVLLRLRDKSVTPGECAVWTVLWAVAATVVLVPDLTSRAAALLGVGRGADLVVYAALALLFYVAFRLTVRMDALDRHVTELTRIYAVKHPETKKDGQ